MKKIVILLSVIVSVSATQLKVPSEYSTIQAGIDAASNGDTVLVAAGTYIENINFNGKNIVVGSLYLTTGDTSYISSTIIDGNESGTVVTMYDTDSTAELVGFTIQNGSSSSGGGLRIGNVGSVIRKVVIKNNTASSGAGVYGDGTSEFIDVKIVNNVATGNYGGGAYFTGGAPTMRNSIIAKNSGAGNGGGVACFDSNPEFTNVLIYSNSADKGGGILCEFSSAPVLKNVTIARNTASQGGGSFYSRADAEITAINSILWSSNSSEIETETGGTVSISYSNVKNGYAGTGNIDADPQFVNTDTTGGKKRDYHLSDSSPAIGAGTATGAPTTDIEGNPRPNPAGSNPDMGAYENSLASPLPKVLKVPSQYSTIQAGIDAASNGDTVLVAAGTYKENIDFKEKNIVVMGENKETTIIDGNKIETQDGGVVSINSGTLSGFTITNGLAEKGGGIYSKDGSGFNLNDLIIKNNEATNGGAIYLKNSSPNITNTIIKSNLGNWGYAAGILLYGSSPILKNVLIVDNKSKTSGGALFCSESNPTLINVTISRNEALFGGGIWFGHDSNPTITNSIIYGNIAKKYNWNIHKNSGILQGELTISYSISDSLYSGTGNIKSDPEFVKVITTGDEESDYHLKDSSPAIGVGTATGAPTTDIEGNPRPNPAGSNPDMGAFENKWGTPQNATPVITVVSDVTINEDESYSDTLRAIDEEGDAITYSASSDTSAVTASITDSILTLTPNTNWHGVANIKAYASDGSSKDSTSFKLTVTPIQDLPTAFEWVSTALDSINISQTNLSETYTLQWDASTDVDGDSIDYLVSAKIGVYPAELIYDTTVTTLPLSYQEIVENVFEGMPNERATVRFSVSATDGIDTVKVTGDDRVLFVNRYEYLSTVSEGIPNEFALHENYPNPFNPTTTLRFDLPEVSDATVTIYNMLGQKVRTFNMNDTPAGYHSIKWDATNDYGDPVGAGVYLYQLRANQFVKTKKMVLLK